MNKRLFLCFIALGFVACCEDFQGLTDSEATAEGNSSFQSSSSSISKTVLTLQNESWHNIVYAKWNNAIYDTIESRNRISKEVESGSGFISLQIANSDEVRLSKDITVENGKAETVIFTGDSKIITKDNSEITLDSLANTLIFLTIKNEFPALLYDVKWNNENFGIIENGTYVKKNVVIGEGYIWLILSEEDTVHTQDYLQIGRGQNITYTITSTTIVVLKNGEKMSLAQLVAIPRCNRIKYDNDVKFCIDEVLYDHCSSIATGKCSDNGVTILTSCNGLGYNENTHFCSGGTIYSKCGVNNYSPSTQFCSSTTVYNKCGGNNYNPSTQFCSSNSVYAKCGGSVTYNPSSEKCCGNTKYNTSTQSCVNNTVCLATWSSIFLGPILWGVSCLF